LEAGHQHISLGVQGVGRVIRRQLELLGEDQKIRVNKVQGVGGVIRRSYRCR
jgi:hypothetical protein